MATVHFAQSLTRYTGGVASVDVDAGRVGELLLEVGERFPALVAPLEVMAVAIDGEVHHEPEFVTLSAESEIHFVPRIAGG